MENDDCNGLRQFFAESLSIERPNFFSEAVWVGVGVGSCVCNKDGLVADTLKH